MKRIWRMAGVGLLMMSVGTQVLADDPRSEGGGQHERGPEGGRQGSEQPRPQNNQPRPQNNQPRPQNQHVDTTARTINRARRTSTLIAPSNSRTAAGSGKAARKVPSRPGQRLRLRITCRSKVARTPCARPKNRARVTTATSRDATTATRIGRPTAQVRARVITVAASTMATPMTTTGQVARMGMAMAGALARNTVRATWSTVSPTAITACLTVARIISFPAATGIARKARAMRW